MTDPDDAPGRDRSRPAPAELRVALAHAERLADPSTARADDPHAVRVLDALDRTRADLARHGATSVPGSTAMPPSVLAGLDRALAAERARPAPARGGGDHEELPEAGRPRLLRLLRPPATTGTRASAVAAVAAVAAVLVVLVAVLAGLPGGDRPPSSPVADGAGPPGPPGPAVLAPPVGVPVLARGDVGIALRAGLGRADYGPLTDPVRRTACLGAHGVPPGAAPAGARQVVVEGRPAVLFVLTTGVAARFRILVVEAGCGPGRPLTLTDGFVGR